MTYLAEKVNTMKALKNQFNPFFYTRRGLSAARQAVLALTLSLGLFLSGCGEEKTAESPAAETPKSSSSAPALPVNGDALVFGSLGEPTNLIPALANDSAASEINDRVFNGLLKIDKDLNIVPSLAERLEISEDGLTFTFHLRKDVRWHDGKPYTSKDAMFTYEIMIDPKTATSYAEPFKQVKKAEAPDLYTFRVTYEKPQARAMVSWCFDQMPAHLLEGQNLESSPLARQPVGTGPYKFEKWESGQRLILTANEDYFEGRPHLNKLIMKIIPDLNAQMLELSSGGLDMMQMTPDQYDEKLGDKNFKNKFNMFRYPAFSYTYLGFNFKSPLFQDKKVRQAIAYAIDKDEIIDGVLLGLGTVANGPFKPDSWTCNKNVKPYPYDVARAKALLAEAGWADSNGDGILDKDGKPFQFTIMTNQGNKVREQTGLIIQARLAEVGIKVNLRVIEWAAFLKEYLDKHNFEAVIMAWTVPVEPDLYDVWHSSKTREGELNYISYKNEEVDKLIDDGRFTLDREKRKMAYDRIQEIFYEEVPYVFLYVPDALPVISSRIIGPEVHPAGIGKNLPQWHVPLDRQVYKQ